MFLYVGERGGDAFVYFPERGGDVLIYSPENSKGRDQGA